VARRAGGGLHSQPRKFFEALAERLVGIIADGKGEVPREAEHLLTWFYDLSGLHTSGMAINPLQPSELAAYFRLVGEAPTPWEVRTLLRMDRAFLDRLSKPKSKPGLHADVNDIDGVRGVLASLKGRKPKRGGMRKIEVAKDE
jgi:hypothetical protein